jgi:hypothetical protein
MGNASNSIIIVLAINLFMGMIALSIQSVDPTSNLLLSNKLFGTTGNHEDNLVVGSINNNTGVYTYDWNNTQYDSLGSASSSQLENSNSIAPDWIRSGWTWALNVGKSYINLVGAPYTIVSALGLDSNLSALIGAFFGIFISFIMLNWLLGREN